MTSGQKHLAFLITLSFLASPRLPAARAFIIDTSQDYWLTTASGTRSGRGDPVTFTWGIVPDGTPIIGFSILSTTINYGPSNLISFLDTQFGTDPNSSEIEDQPWFHYFADSFGRWSELSGATYIYEPNDDGATINTPSGTLGVRGDLRIGGAGIDEENGILAFSTFPDNGDMVIDTDDGVFLSTPANLHRSLRNTIMHEHGHGFGLLHVNSTTDNLLMGQSTDGNDPFDGPQLDEVRAIQYYFGDANEKSNDGMGNDTADLATDLGPLTPGSPVAVGTDADVPTQFIEPTATDFVSIANKNDTDYFSFSVAQPSRLSAVLTPRGGQFTQALPASEGGGTPQFFDASARSDLSLAIYDTDGTTPLTENELPVNDTGLGGVEMVADLQLPGAGQYYAQIISGPEDTIQLYELELSVINFYTADFDEDGDVDDNDLGIWELAYGTTDLGDADADGDSDGDDFLAWQKQYTGELGLSSLAVPEPGAAMLFLLAAAPILRRRQTSP